MRARLRGAVGGSSARLCTYEALYLQMCAAERGGSEPKWFPRAPLTLLHNGWNKHIYIYIFIPLPLANPVSTDMLSVGWNNIFFVPFAQRHSITPEADSCLRGEAEPLPTASAQFSLYTNHFIRQDSTFNPIVIQLRYFNSTLSLINAS